MSERQVSLLHKVAAPRNVDRPFTCSAGGAPAPQVSLTDGFMTGGPDEFKAKLVGYDADKDLAVLKIDVPDNSVRAAAPPLPLLSHTVLSPSSPSVFVPSLASSHLQARIGQGDHPGLCGSLMTPRCSDRHGDQKLRSSNLWRCESLEASEK